MEGFLAEVRLFGGNFAPRNWQFCSGQLLQISSNQALFSLIGTIYGGDGRTSFALPDLRGRAGVGVGTGPGLANMREGQKVGNELTILSVTNMPAHSHVATGVLKCNSALGNVQTPVGNVVASDAAQSSFTYSSASATGTMAANSVDVTVGNAGLSSGFSNVQPSLALNYIICVSGTFPSRN